jgi:hypothetical protein
VPVRDRSTWLLDWHAAHAQREVRDRKCIVVERGLNWDRDFEYLNYLTKMVVREVITGNTVNTYKSSVR